MDCSRAERVYAALQCFYCPVVRHLWWWLGGRPASASIMRAMLGRGHSALVCPGGVRECLYMEHGREAVYLSNRTGFVRIALQYGVPLPQSSRQQADEMTPAPLTNCIPCWADDVQGSSA